MCLSSRFVNKTLHPFSEAVGSNTFAHQLHHQLTIMPVISERVSIRSLDFRTQRKAYMLRYIKKQSWETIAQQIRNVSGDHPSWGCVRDTVQGISVSKGIRTLNYARCGRKPWKMSDEVQQFIIRRLVARRVSQIVTSVTLQAELAAEMGIVVEESTIRKLLKKRGYRWLLRNQKRKYNQAQKRERVAFARGVLRLSRAALRQKMSMSLDGVVLSMPPAKEIERFNYCWGAATHMWRKRSEGNAPKLAGADDYDKQVPITRAIPLWGGLSESGFAPVLWHPYKKTNKEEWSKAVRDGSLTGALKFLNPNNKKGPWTVLCDGEGFLRAKLCMPAYRAKGISLWSCPPKSPDLNPIEMFWGWIRRKLRLMDLADLRLKRRPLGKTAYTLRVKRVMQTQKAQTVAKNIATRFRKACVQVVKRKGAAADN